MLFFYRLNFVLTAFHILYLNPLSVTYPGILQIPSDSLLACSWTCSSSDKYLVLGSFT